MEKKQRERVRETQESEITSIIQRNKHTHTHQERERKKRKRDKERGEVTRKSGIRIRNS